MIDFKVEIGRDTFGTFVETENYNDLDELEDLLIEHFSLIPKGIIDGSANTGGLYGTTAYQTRLSNYYHWILNIIGN